MPKKIEITEIEFLKIRELYLNKKLTIKQIAKILPYSETFITETLKKQKIYINTKYIIKENFKKSDLKKEIIRLKDELLKRNFKFIKQINDDNSCFIAICKKTGKSFNDYKNSSGTLTEHLKKIYPELIHPSNFIKREYKNKNGKYWHEQYFDIIEQKKIQKDYINCKYCDWTTIDTENKSGQYTSHLIKQHNISIESHLKLFPSETVLFKTQNLKMQRNILLTSSTENYIECKICGHKLKYMTNSHLKTHNTNISEYKINNPKSNTLSNNYLEKLKEKYETTLKFCSNTFASNAQKEIISFLKENDIDCKLNNKKILNGVEIDVLSEKYKIGIEYNGNFYHTEVGGLKNRSYHLNKTKLMNEKEYGLIHIFEDEWQMNKKIVKSKLLHIFNKGKYVNKIYARNCLIKEISADLKNDFLNKYHIQGEDRSNIHLGAFFNNMLVSIMTFDNNRQMSLKNDLNVFELKRFCSIDDFLVIGVAGKLLSYFVKKYNPKKIISFADRRWTLNKENNLYTKLGFKLIKILSPDYSYYNPKINRLKRFHKFSFGKSSLRKKFPQIYDNNKTEWEMMQELGYDRIWDCGKFKYEMTF